jgi:type VI secretion system protein ImpF
MAPAGDAGRGPGTSGPTTTGAWTQRRADVERPVQQSVFDRLMDDDPGTSAERQPTRAETVAALRAAVRRDLEWLLNTRRELVRMPDGLTEAPLSLVRYGLPDVSSLPRDGSTAGILTRAVEEAIARFEPRLAQVRVRPLASTDAEGRATVRFTIEALLRLDPRPERVVFDTVLEMARGEYQVRGAAPAAGAPADA